MNLGLVYQAQNVCAFKDGVWTLTMISFETSDFEYRTIPLHCPMEARTSNSEHTPKSPINGVHDIARLANGGHRSGLLGGCGSVEEGRGGGGGHLTT